MSDDPKDNVILFPDGREISIAQIHTQEYKSKGHLQVGMRMKLISDLITDHSQEIGSLRPNQCVKVTGVDVQGDMSVVDVELFEKELN